jgi:tetratricopeptide (TPR) repeat protein
LVEIPFRGTGWVYLGELEARRGIAYGSRRFDPEGQSFVFRAEEPGSYSLKFYKQDFIRDSVINDYVRVIVGESAGTGEIGPFNPPVDRGRVIAEPRWPPPSGTAAGSPVAAVPPDRAVPSATAALPVSTGEDPVPAPPLVPAATGPPAGDPGTAGSGETPSGGELRLGEELRADQYLSRAREEFDAGRVPAALGFLDQFREQYPSGSDEAWWLYGQFFEANSPSRDIRSALDYYRRLIREYPQSSRYNDARRRISYLERYYFNIP